MPPKERLNPIVKWAGMALAIGAAIFVAQRLWAQSSQLPPGILGDALPCLIAASCLYAASGVLLGISWWLALRIAGVQNLSVLRSSAAWLASQIGKYLPGNVGHFVARHLIERRHGADHSALVGAMIIESLVLVAAAGTLALFIAETLLAPRFPSEPLVNLIWAIPVLAMAFLISALLLARRHEWLRMPQPPSAQMGEISAALALGFLFFAIGSLCLVLMSVSLELSDWPRILPWLAAAWLLGFAVPGAPGGLGVRELVLVVGLTPMIGEANAALDAILFRLVTVGGDAIMSAAGTLWLGRKNRLS